MVFCQLFEIKVFFQKVKKYWLSINADFGFGVSKVYIESLYFEESERRKFEEEKRKFEAAKEQFLRDNPTFLSQDTKI